MKGLRLYLWGSGVVLIFYVMAQYYQPKHTDWTPTYLKEDKIPYGLYILNKQMEQLFPGSLISTSGLRVYNTLKNKNYRNTSYLLIANKINLDEPDMNELIRFMQSGNHVFIASYDLGNLAGKKLKLKIGSSFNSFKGDGPAIRFVNPQLNPGHDYTLPRGMGQQYFTELDTARAIALGQTRTGRTNFVKYKFGKGALYILPDPQLLTNINLLDARGADYAAKALSYLPASKTIIWDENNTRKNTADSSVFRVISKYPPLNWAYNLALSGILIFVLFEMKRRQRIIPVLAPLKNSSVEFVKLVGKVYYQKRDNRDISDKKITYFLAYLRTNLQLKTLNIDDELAAAVIDKSGVHEETVKDLFNLINKIKNQNWVKDHELIQLNKLIENFYKQAH